MDEKTEAPAPEQTEEPKPEEHPRILPLHLLGSRFLRATMAPVEEITDDVRTLATLMETTMFHVNGIGLAAPQVGVPLRLFVMEHKQEQKVLHLANPEINAIEGTQEFTEGCLSQPGLSVVITRPKYIAIKALNVMTGEEVIVEGTDLEAACISHEMDHLNGKLICDYLSYLRRDMYRRRLRKQLKKHDRLEARKAASDTSHIRKPLHTVR